MGIKDKETKNISPVVRKFLNIDEFKIPQDEALLSAISDLKKEKQAVILTDTLLTRCQILESNISKAKVLLISCIPIIQMIIKGLYPEKKVISIESFENFEEIYLALKYELPEVHIPKDKISEIEHIIKLLK